MAQELLIRDTVAPHVQAATLLGSGGISISYGSGSITINGTGGGFAWNNVTSLDNPVSLVSENGYVASGAGVVNFVLPASAAFGESYNIIGNGNLWTIAQNAGQNIVLGNQQTSAGVFGSLSASMISDCVEIVCIVPNTKFQIDSSIGNLILT